MFVRFGSLTDCCSEVSNRKEKVGVQYTIIAEPAKRRWYPLWREQDQETWQHFLVAGEIISCPTQPEAQEYINRWRRTFSILSISRPFLHSLGFFPEGITSLTDEDMEQIATTVRTNILFAAEMNFDEEVRFVVACEIVENVST